MQFSACFLCAGLQEEELCAVLCQERFRLGTGKKFFTFWVVSH